MNRRPPLSKSEFEIVQLLWRLGEVRVCAVVDALPPDRRLDFFTVQTYLRRLKTKGYLKTRREGRADVYLPAIPPTRVLRQVVTDFLNRAFDGRVLPLMQHLVDDRGLSADEIQQLQAMLDQLKKGEVTNDR